MKQNIMNIFIRLIKLTKFQLRKNKFSSPHGKNKTKHLRIKMQLINRF